MRHEFIFGGRGVEPPNPRPQELRAHLARHAAEHVHDATAREVSLAECSKPPAAPGPVHHHGVDECCQQARNDHLRAQVAAFCQAPGHDRGCGPREGPLEQPVAPLVVGRGSCELRCAHVNHELVFSLTLCYTLTQ